MSEERLQKILRLIESNRTISAKELEAQLYVSSATVRRDLTELSRRGLIVRSHGKAMAVTRMAHAVTPSALPLPRWSSPTASFLLPQAASARHWQRR